MLKTLDGKTPQIDPTAFVSETAYLIGDVEVGPMSSIWPGVVIRADSGKIKIGSYTNIQDNSVLHADDDAEIGNHTTIGHNVMCHAKRIGDNCLLGNGAVLNDGCEIGNDCLVGANSTVVENMVVGDGSLVLGTPARVRGEVKDHHKAMIRGATDHYVEARGRYKDNGGFE
ncbi:MAG: gamma carbonic anhydrase family protein [Dehalococcoidia bacterium]|jgi:carbonic anhydrase/acetyltransferase-like protein (isoleucine patch superfamily)|nr:gamma carbonic anhydrase family protein [Dehalococcoidia bacterium]